MTASEVENIVQLEEIKVSLDGNIIYGIYQDDNHNQYHIYFNGNPPKLDFWSTYTFEDNKLQEIEELRVDSPLDAIFGQR